MAKKSLDEILGGVKRFGRLTVINESEGRPCKSTARANGFIRRMVAVVCDCGAVKVVAAAKLTGGQTKSCGCWSRDTVIKRSRTHGQTAGGRTSEYSAWKSAKARCFIPSVSNWDNYGGRGITMCDRWKNSFEAFFADMGRKPGPEYSIDRIDNDGNYEPGNCRWADKGHQVRNRRVALMINYGGRSYNCSEAAEKFGFKAHTLAKRIRDGWPHDLAIETPLQPGRKFVSQ